MKEFTCLRENTEKYIIFAVPIEKVVTRIKTNREKIAKNLSYILQFIDSAKFMASYYQILSITFLKESRELNLNLDAMIKNAKFGDYIRSMRLFSWIHKL